MKSKGSTLLELIIVAAIIGILAAIAIPNFLMSQCRAKGKELNLNTAVISAVCRECTGCKSRGINARQALEEIANGTKAHYFLSHDVLKELADDGVSVEVPIHEDSKPKHTNPLEPFTDRCLLQQTTIRELKYQIKQLKRQLNMYESEETQSWRE